MFEFWGFLSSWIILWRFRLDLVSFDYWLWLTLRTLLWKGQGWVGNSVDIDDTVNMKLIVIRFRWFYHLWKILSIHYPVDVSHIHKERGFSNDKMLLVDQVSRDGDPSMSLRLINTSYDSHPGNQKWKKFISKLYKWSNLELDCDSLNWYLFVCLTIHTHLLIINTYIITLSFFLVMTVYLLVTGIIIYCHY